MVWNRIQFEYGKEKVAEILTPTVNDIIHKIKQFSFHTIQLDDFHSFSFDVLTNEAEALFFKVTLEFRINLHKDNIQN